MRSFASIDDIAAADVDKLASVPEIPQDVAQNIFDYFHPKDGENEPESGN